MDALLNVMRREAQRTGAGVARTRLATVTAYDPKRYAIRAAIQPEGVETGWASIMASGTGAGVGIFAPPAIGAQVILAFAEGDTDSPICLGAIYSDAQPPPNVPTGEAHIVAPSGAIVRCKANGDVEIVAAGAARITASGKIVVDSPDIRLGGDGATQPVRLANNSAATRVRAI